MEILLAYSLGILKSQKAAWCLLFLLPLRSFAGESCQRLYKRLHIKWYPWLFVCFSGSKSFLFFLQDGRQRQAVPDTSLYLSCGSLEGGVDRRWYKELTLYVLLCCCCCGPEAYSWCSQGRDHISLRSGICLQMFQSLYLFWISPPTRPLVCRLLFLSHPCGGHILDALKHRFPLITSPSATAPVILNF